MKPRYLAGIAGILLAGAVMAQAPVIPLVPMVGPTDIVPIVPGGVPTAQQQHVSALTLAGYGGTLPARANVLVGGDATTNLFQRATTGASVTTTTTYGGPDRWAYWSGTGTAMTVSRDSTAADLPSSSYLYGFKMARTSGQTGVIQVCMAQAVESANSYQFQGATVELDFHATAGANFSAAGSNMTAYIVTGTGTDEGVAKLAFGINAGGGGGSGWTGQANATAAVIPISTSNSRYAAVATIPAGATEIGVALCFTPVGTAGANDYIAFSAIQLIRNASLAASASATAGYSCSIATGGGGQPGIPCSSFDRTRGVAQETALQQRYYYQLTEGAAIAPVAPCAAVDTTHTNCLIQFPVSMRIAPTMTYANGFASPTSTTQGTLGACTTLTSAATVASTVANTLNVLVNCAASTIPAAGIASFLYTNNGTGTIKASAEL